jgi:DNA-binding transcriptional regulator YiaG
MTPRQIKQLRKSRGWTVRDLAEKTGVSPRTVEGWEQGRKPSAAALRLLKLLKKEPHNN